MLAENTRLFAELGITAYHAKGKLGQGRKVVVLDSTTSGNHQAQIVREGAEIAPSCISIYLDRLKMKESVDYIFAHASEIDAINCSWHSSENKEFERLEALDIPVYCASGNGSDEEVVYPGSLPWTISVGAWDTSRTLIANYSSYGSDLDCVVPDDFYWLTATTGQAMNNTGTSFCSPAVMYMMALVGKFTRAGAKAYIALNCVDVLDKGMDIKTGHGVFTLPEPKEEDMTNIIGIDPGHGGIDPGAISKNGLQESFITMAIASKLADLMRGNGMNPILTRTMDTAKELSARTNLLNLSGCAAAISIHINASTSPDANYIATYIQGTGGDAERFAKLVQAELVSATNWKDGGVRVENFHMTRETKMPTILVELGFISNPTQEAWLANGVNRGILALALAQGILAYYGKPKIEEEISMVGKTIQGEYTVRFQGQTLSKKAIVVDGASYLPVRALAEKGAYRIESIDNSHKTINLS